MNKLKTSWLAIPALLVAAGCANSPEVANDPEYYRPANTGVTAAETTVAPKPAPAPAIALRSSPDYSSSPDYKLATAHWKATPAKALSEMVQKYGPPDEITDKRVIWHQQGPWKRIEVVNEEAEHNFPVRHKDVLEHVIEYRVSPNQCSELAEFDGSVIVERTKGELAARCDSEAHNILALNVANDIVTGKKTVAEARAFLAETVGAEQKGEVRPYMQKLQFLSPTGGSADPDQTFTDPMEVPPGPGSQQELTPRLDQ